MLDFRPVEDALSKAWPEGLLIGKEKPFLK